MKNKYSFNNNNKDQIIIEIINSIVSQTSPDKISEELLKFKSAFEDFLKSIPVIILQNEDKFDCNLVYLCLFAYDIELSSEIYTKKRKKEEEKKK
jgi:hypothetical protein